MSLIFFIYFFKTFWVLIAFLLLASCSNKNKNIFLKFNGSAIDGDTVSFNKQIIRLFGVDTPELHDQYKNFALTTGIEAIYALESKKFTQNFLQNQCVTVNLIKKDQYGRSIAKINKGEDLGLLLVKKGLARVAYISLNPKSPFFLQKIKLIILNYWESNMAHL